MMTNTEQSAAHRILQKHGIDHKLQGHRLPLTSDEFAIEIGIIRCTEFDDVRKHVRRVANDHLNAAVDLVAWTIADMRQSVRRDADAHKP